jgi:hypothetical protein
MYAKKKKGKMISAHDNLNRLRVKIAKQKDASLAKLPPCEASFVQHVLRASLQTKRQLDARIICSFHHHYLHLQFESTGCNMHQSLEIDIAQCRSDFVQHKHNPENTKICLYMYTANMSENLKKLG